MISVDQLSNGGNEKVHKFLLEAKEDPEKRKVFEIGLDDEESNSTESILKAAMEEPVEKKEVMEEKNESEEEKRLKELKEKAALKKQKMKEKFQKTQKGMIDKLISRTSSLDGEDDELCILCRERRKK